MLYLGKPISGYYFLQLDQDCLVTHQMDHREGGGVHNNGVCLVVTQANGREIWQVEVAESRQVWWRFASVI